METENMNQSEEQTLPKVKMLNGQREQEVLTWLNREKVGNEFILSPNQYRQMASEQGVHPATICGVIEALAKKGIIGKKKLPQGQGYLVIFSPTKAKKEAEPKKPNRHTPRTPAQIRAAVNEDILKLERGISEAEKLISEKKAFLAQLDSYLTKEV